MENLYRNAMMGALAADAVAMPVHWYYDTTAMDRDYGEIDSFRRPINPHPDSILWRSRYVARNKKGEILHEQAQYWGKRGIHYHQFLEAGENTVNYKLGVELYRQIRTRNAYDADRWLDRYIEVMRTPGWHRDTYVEEYHRAFFDNLAQGKRPRGCGIDDIHIGGLTPVPFLLAGLKEIGNVDLEEQITLTRAHLELTHRNEEVLCAGESMVRILHALHGGHTLRSAIEENAARWSKNESWARWASMDDRNIVGGELSPACYLPASFTASLALAWKYAEDFSGGILANARCGGDNCHRGVVVGALLGATLGVPEQWTQARNQTNLPRPASEFPS